MNKKPYSIPQTECLNMSFETCFLASANGSGKGTDLTANPLAGDFGDYFDF